MSFRQPPRSDSDLLVSQALAAAWHPEGLRPPEAVPMTSGLADLDRIGALRPGRATVVTGHPGAGASALALGIALHVATHHRGSVLYVTDHLDGDEVEQRLVALEGRINLNGPLRHVEDEALQQRRLDTLESLGRLLIAILPVDEGVTPRRIAGYAHELERAEQPPRLLVIDRVSSLHPAPGDSRETRSLVTALLDLIDHRAATTILVERPPVGSWRGCPNTTDRAPTVAVSPLFADLGPRLQSVLWLHRAEMFDEDTPDRGLGEIHVLWQRQGATGVIRAAFLPHLSRWADLARRPGIESSSEDHPLPGAVDRGPK